MVDHTDKAGNPSDDMSEYLQTFLDETDEQLDDLVETMLALEKDVTNREELNEAFRLIHSIKGSAGMMGFDSIAVLTHHLENRFEQFRSGFDQLDEPTMNLVLQSIDFLKQCNQQLREGSPLASSSALLDELRQLEEASDGEKSKSQLTEAATQAASEEVATAPAPADTTSPQSVTDEGGMSLRVKFRDGLPLVDLKAQLIATRLAKICEIRSTKPALSDLAAVEQLGQFEIAFDECENLDALRDAADVDGVEEIEFASLGDHHEPAEPSTDEPADEPASAQPVVDDEAEAPSSSSAPDLSAVAPREARQPEPTIAVPAAAGKVPSKVAETMRVDIDRLDNLMNLAGELVVNRARFVQVTGQVSPALRNANMANRVRDFSDALRQTIAQMESLEGADGDWSLQIQRLRSGLKMMDEQTAAWDNDRNCFSQIGEAIDQLSRVSHSFQRGVLDTRMVPFEPLFNRFRRVVRDLSKDRDKQVELRIRGEKTELDKRMIDELGDPLVHLVRNSIDHGLESTDVRLKAGKSETGTVTLEAIHSGNNVYVQVSDDGAGIDIDKIKRKLVASQLVSDSEAEQLSEDQALGYIWHPGFSTAKEVTDVSGRGVGMDAVKTRIDQLNGSIEVTSVPGQGTTFTIRLPLTLAIVNCLLVRLRSTLFSMPIDDVREIVSVNERDIVNVHGKSTFDLRGEFIPLVSVDDVFEWHEVDYGYRSNAPTPSKSVTDVVVLHAGGRTLGLRVDELLASQDIVIKSLSDNFINIRGLSGASILGDGNVCLMLDVGTVISMVTQPRGAREEAAV